MTQTAQYRSPDLVRAGRKGEALVASRIAAALQRALEDQPPEDMDPRYLILGLRRVAALEDRARTDFPLIVCGSPLPSTPDEKAATAFYPTFLMSYSKSREPPKRSGELRRNIEGQERVFGDLRRYRNALLYADTPEAKELIPPTIELFTKWYEFFSQAR